MQLRIVFKGSRGRLRCQLSFETMFGWFLMKNEAEIAQKVLRAHSTPPHPIDRPKSPTWLGLSYDKCTNFCSIVCINEGHNSITLVQKIPNGFEITSRQIWEYKYPYWNGLFFVLSTLMACDSKTIGNFGTKTYGIVPHVDAKNWRKNWCIYHNLKVVF